MWQEVSDKSSKKPLCVFCLSPPFSIRAFTRPPERPASRRFSVRSWRRGDSSLSVRTRFKPLKRRSCKSLNKYLSGFFGDHKKSTLSLQEVLEEIRKAWGEESFANSCTMEEKSTEIVSPILLRRRLSAPETIMRKHTLAQQRSECQDNEVAQSEKMSHYRSEAGSDTSLNRRQDPDLIRKNTLLRRLWGHSKPLSSRFTGSFYEWQHSWGKLNRSSSHSSSEHLVRSHSKRFINEIKPNSPKRKSRSSVYDTETTKTTTTTPKTETETRLSYTTFSDNSDSAYANTNNSEFSNNNSDQKEDNASFQSANETGTQTVGTTNVNVISNVQLSQSTLDLIFNQVIQDVKKQDCEGNIIQVKQIPSFFLQRKESDIKPDKRIVKMISNVGVGSPYTKPMEPPQVAVPRFSARPHTSSMEVNISSGESTDKESDTISLVDSLEDSSSLRTDPTRSEIIATKSDISLELPDNSDSKKTSKPTAFFIPIEIDRRKHFKPVSEHLPEKVRNRLVKRQQKREERFNKNSSTSRSDSNYISASENGNHVHHLIDNGDVNLNSTPLPNVNYGKSKKRLLPSIESFRRVKNDRAKSETKIKSVKRKPKEKSDFYTSRTKPTQWIPKSKNEYVYDYGSERIYHSDDSRKRIEILEIMECVDPDKQSKSKSKIPVLINNKLPKINQKKEKPAFLDFENNATMTDSKLDQLIANILIETLNIPEDSVQDEPESSTSKQYKKFETIPEENNDVSNNNESHEEKKSYKGKAAVAVVKDENFSSIPKGWITFYMLHNNRGTPDSTSDEGKKINVDQKEIKNINERNFDIIKKEKRAYESNENCSSSSDVRVKTVLPPANPGRYKKYNMKKMRHKSDEADKTKRIGEWSVTVSGTNSYGQFAPDLEMCLKFPDSQKNYNCPSQSDSGVGEDNEHKSHIRKMNPKQDQNEDIYMQRLPDIDKGTKKQKRSDSSIPSLSSRIIEPRQTRTSTRRYHLTRPKIDYQKLDTPRNAVSLFNESHYAELLKRFPEILSITGNAINQGQK